MATTSFSVSACMSRQQRSLASILVTAHPLLGGLCGPELIPKLGIGRTGHNDRCTVGVGSDIENLQVAEPTDHGCAVRHGLSLTPSRVRMRHLLVHLILHP